MKAKCHPTNARGQRAPNLVIQIDNLNSVETEEIVEPELGGQIRFHGAVIIEMVAGEIGEHAGRESQPIEPPLIEAVGRRLHGYVGDTPTLKGGEGSLQINGSRRRQGARGGRNRLVLSIEGAQSSDAAGGVLLIQKMADEPGGGGFPISAGYSDQREAASGVPIPGSAEDQCRTSAVSNYDLRYACYLGSLHQDRRRTSRDRIGHKSVPVRLRSPHRDVEHTGPDAPAVYPQRSGIRAGARRRVEKIDPAKLREHLRPG